MLGNSSTLPLWIVVLLGGILVNFVLGTINPFVPKKYRRKAEEFRKGHFREGAPLIIVRARFDGAVYVIVLACINIAYSILFFMESYSHIVAACKRAFVGCLSTILLYLIILTIYSVILLVAAFWGEYSAAEQIVKYYRKRYYVMVFFEKAGFGDWTYDGKQTVDDLDQWQSDYDE